MPRSSARPSRAPAVRSSQPAEATVIVWSAYDEDPATLVELLHDGVRLVQLDSAGVDHLLEAGLIDDRRSWAAAQGAYAGRPRRARARPAAGRGEAAPARRARPGLGAPRSRRLAGSTVAVVGAGGIGSACSSCSLRSASRPSPSRAVGQSGRRSRPLARAGGLGEALARATTPSSRFR